MNQQNYKPNYDNILHKFQGHILLGCIISLLFLIILDKNSFFSKEIMIIFLIILIMFTIHYFYTERINSNLGKLGMKKSFFTKFLDYINHLLFPNKSQIIYDSFSFKKTNGQLPANFIFTNSNINLSFMDKTRELKQPPNNFQFINPEIIEQQGTDKKVRFLNENLNNQRKIVDFKNNEYEGKKNFICRNIKGH